MQPVENSNYAANEGLSLTPDGGKTQSIAISIPSVSLPKGGGAIKGIDEKFAVNAINGTAGFSLPLPFSPARGASPALSLSYNSGNGNSIFGLGWNLGLSFIRRKTDKKLPEYLDEEDSDIFLFSEAEDLVPCFKKNEDGSFLLHNDGYVFDEKESGDGVFLIRYYRPRIEGLFARIERWRAKDASEIKWKITTRDNVSTLFGWSTRSRIADPKDAARIFEWLPEFTFDDRGNCCRYIYQAEDAAGIDLGALHNKNRLQGEQIVYTNLYLQAVLYGNKTPYTAFGNPYPGEDDFLFSTRFDYGTLKNDNAPDILKDRDFRPDAFSDYKAGFEIRTTRLCKRVLLFHHFKGANEYEGLVRSLNFEYDTGTEDFTFLKKIHACGYIKNTDGRYSRKQLPPMEFSYQAHEWNSEVKTVESAPLLHAPCGIGDPRYQFTDLFNEGLSGILTEQGNSWFYKHNLGNATFEAARLVSPKPSFTGLGTALQLTDLGADGGRQLVHYHNGTPGFFELNDDSEWENFRSFQGMPNVDFGDANTRMFDLDGDGRPELVISEEKVFTWYPSAGRKGFTKAVKTEKAFNEETGPALVFSEVLQTIFLADMSGNGMNDIVRIRNGEVCYWPNLGYGKFGAKITMDNAPVFDEPAAFNPAYIRLADIDGSGTTDIIYLGKNKFTCYKNLSGNRFGASPYEISPFPEIHSLATVTVADLLGNGVACIVWGSPLEKDAAAPLKYIDLMNGRKPHIMTGYKNNMGKEVRMEYTASTQFYIEDKLAGKPWVTKLHFPVHCISRTITEDKISGYRFESAYKYHHGYYDHAEREFRGFGMVEQTDAETFEHWVKTGAANITEEAMHQEPVVSKTWFHTGAFLRKDKILGQFEQDYWYNEMDRYGYPVTHHEKKLPDAQLVTAPGLDSALPETFSTDEWQQALRSCKGMPLRSEVFARDAVKAGNAEAAGRKELIPFSASTHNCVVELLQPKGRNKHAVFIVKESETITYNYERDPEDPRITHNLNIRLDEHGNVLESAAVVYPRRVADNTLPEQTKEAQTRMVILYSRNRFTNDVTGDAVYRLRLPSEMQTYELKHVNKADQYYSITDLGNILDDTFSDEAAYHETDKPAISGRAQRRLIEHVRSTYYSNDLAKPLPLHQLASLALPYESYQLAYTPELVTDIFGDKVTDDLLEEGRFTHSEDDSNWWIRSGTTQLLSDGETAADAAARFYAPVSYTDPYGAVTKVTYYGDYFLFIERTEDALGNTGSVEKFNFRTLSPQRMKDINANVSEAISDELGMVKAMAVMGKGEQADDLSGLSEETTEAEQTLIQDIFNTEDSVAIHNIGRTLLGHATARFVYNWDAYAATDQPTVVAAISRETHFRRPDGTENPETKLQVAFEYSNGIGEVVMQKAQAEPGRAKQVQVNPADVTIIINEVDTGARLRWIGNGRTIKNNKGNPVKQYDPYFSVTPQYESYKELVETGVTPLLYYDAAGRLIRTEMPDGSFSKMEFDSWKQVVYDANDTVLGSDWYKRRTDGIHLFYIADAGEQQAAAKAAAHADTPNTLHVDTLGRPILSVEHNKTPEGADEFYHTMVQLDTEGNLRSVTDARGNTVVQYKYDMLGNKVYQNSMDAGQHWLLLNITGNPLRTWDERRHEFQYFYDQLQRPTYSKVLCRDSDASLDHVFSKIIYGESLLTTNRTNEAALQEDNILGQPIKVWDTGGMITTPRYDLKGQPLSVTRRLFSKYKEVANWTDANLTNDLEKDEFTFTTDTDALGRIIRQRAPDGSIIEPSYNEAGLLDAETVLHPGDTEPAVYIKNIDYNEKGQREKIIYGNDVNTKFYYDKETFRLKRLESKRLNGDPLQDLYYTYDPVGNITHIADKAIPVVFFNNQKTEGVNEYSYDVLYRLVKATGRENNAALNFVQDNWNDAAFMHQRNPGDAMAMRNYTQQYNYDAVGNILQIKHTADSGSWTRNTVYETNSNRLKSSAIGDHNFSYPHHAQHGFITALPHLEEINWNFKEEVIRTIRQRRSDGGIPETTYYQYDGSGQRIRKITENQAGPGTTPTRKDERIYIGGYETYRTYHNNTVNFERNCLSMMDGDHRFVIVETILKNELPTPSPLERAGERLVRYQLHNHLGSAALELDAAAQVISYEEYHPFGTTAYQANNTNIKATAKRYRYTGMERDEETELEYHSARYYLPWLGRWLSSDPIGIEGGMNVYEYCGNGPSVNTDIKGMEGLATNSNITGNTTISAEKTYNIGNVWFKYSQFFDSDSGLTWRINYVYYQGDEDWIELNQVQYERAIYAAKDIERIMSTEEGRMRMEYLDYLTSGKPLLQYAGIILLITASIYFPGISSAVTLSQAKDENDPHMMGLLGIASAGSEASKIYKAGRGTTSHSAQRSDSLLLSGQADDVARNIGSSPDDQFPFVIQPGGQTYNGAIYRINGNNISWETRTNVLHVESAIRRQLSINSDITDVRILSGTHGSKSGRTGISDPSLLEPNFYWEDVMTSRRLPVSTRVYDVRDATQVSRFQILEARSSPTQLCVRAYCYSAYSTPDR